MGGRALRNVVEVNAGGDPRRRARAAVHIDDMQIVTRRRVRITEIDELLLRAAAGEKWE
jgi:hypothetical protein